MATRRIAALVTTLMLSLGSIALIAPSAEAAALPKRAVTSNVVKKKGNLVFTGKVDPGDPGKLVLIQRKKCRQCAWRFYAKTQTGDVLRFRQRLAVPRKGAWFYRAKVPAYDGYGTSFSGVWKVYLK